MIQYKTTTNHAYFWNSSVSIIVFPERASQTIMSTETDNVQAMTETSQVTETLLEANIEQGRAADNAPESVAQPTGESASLLAKADDDVSTATIWSSVANMTNNVLGAGLVALPYSISQVSASFAVRSSVRWSLEFYSLFLWPL